MLKNRIKTLEDRPQLITRPELLLLPQIPKPMHGLAPRVVLGRKWWDQTRKEAYRKTWFHCLACGVHKSKVNGSNRWLEAHEVYRTDHPIGRIYYIESVPLCPFCHAYIHQGRLVALLEKRQITQHKFTSVIMHGEEVLAEAGLQRPLPYEGPMAEWSTWRLVIGRKMYKPLYKTMEDWMKHYDQVVVEE